MKRTRQLILATALLTGATTAQAQLVINELMQSNIDCIMDDLNEFPDSWVELYNTGDDTVNLQDYKLSNKTKAKNAWQLPAKTVNPKGHVIVYCDKEEVGLHTNFRLESGKGCVVYLFKNGEIVDSLPEALKKQPAPNIAYGRKTDGADKWGYQLTPTPSAANSGQVCDIKHILGEPIFSRQGQVQAGTDGFNLRLSLPDDAPEGAVIRYTTNGQEPTANSTLFRSAIAIKKSTTVRAKLFCDGWLSPRSTVQSYIMLGRDMTIPVVSITINDKYLNDSKIGIYANNTGNDNKNDWRRPLNIEFFADADAPSVINQLCETRVAGGISRGAALKTLAIYANKRFGEKHFDYEFFPEDKPGLTDFKSLMLRNAGNDFDGLYMRDAIIQRNAASHIDLDWQGYRPAVVYINGEYKGMLNIRERSNEDNIYTNYDGLEDLDMFENWNELKEGSWANYDAFKAFYSEKGHSMEEYEAWMDVSEFINLFVINLYHINLDFPGNNIVMWRPTADDGKWRWVMKDTDFGLGLYSRSVSYSIFNWLYNPDFDPQNNWGANSEEGTRLFRNLMENDEFKTMFTDRCLIFTGDFLNEKGIREVWDPMLERARAEIIRHKELYKPSWGGWWYNAEQTYDDEVSAVRTWIKNRTAQFLNQLTSYYKLGTLIPLTINKDVEGADETGLTFNGVKLSKGTFDGKFLKDRTIILEGAPEAQKVVTGWEVTTNGTSTKKYEGSRLEIPMPQCNRLAITAILDVNTGISDAMRLNDKGQMINDNCYDLSGRKMRTGTTSLNDLPRGIYVINGRKVVK